MSSARVEPAGPLRGTLRPPPDKSISHRAGLMAAMAEGSTAIAGFLDSADTRSTLAAIEALGPAVVADAGRAPGSLDVTVSGAGLHGPGDSWRGPGALALDVGNAGTLLRMLPGWLAGQRRGEWSLDGDESIRRRPVDRVVEPLSLMGGRLSARDGERPPLRVSGARLHGISYELPVASAQVKSCILLAGLMADGTTRVCEPAPSRDHTERMLAAAGAPVRRGPGAVEVDPVERLRPGTLEVPGDLSSAAFFVVAATLIPGSEVRVEGVGLNPTRTGFLGILERMGADLEVEASEAAGGEPVGSIVARHAELRGVRIAPEEVPPAIDELPLIALAGALADGRTEIAGAAELRHKESDRIETVVGALRDLGVEAEALPDGIAVRGAGALRGGAVEPAGDHRLAMMGAVAGLASTGGVEVRGADIARISYPGFARDLAALTPG